MQLKPETREKVSFSLAGIAVLLRMASDWLFPNGGPLWYQIVQAIFLGLALVGLWPRLEVVYLKHTLAHPHYFWRGNFVSNEEIQI